MSAVELNFGQNPVEFPQPTLEKPVYGVGYFTVTGANQVWGFIWENGNLDAERLCAGSVYLTREEAEQRAAWNAQQMARLVIPTWFRDLGADVEFDASMPWANAPEWKPFSAPVTQDWSQINPKRLRSKPRDVVVTVNGKEYRWPATVPKGAPPCERFFACPGSGVHGVSSDSWGNRTHFTRAGAEAQSAAMKAAAGESL